jgi:hypothetical protein
MVAALVVSSFMPHLGAAPGCVAGDLGVDRADRGDWPCAGRHGGRVVHLGDQGQDLVRRSGQPGVQLLSLGLQLRRTPQPLELLRP